MSSADEMVCVSRGELAALIARQFSADVRTTYGASADDFVRGVVGALPTSRPVGWAKDMEGIVYDLAAAEDEVVSDDRCAFCGIEVIPPGEYRRGPFHHDATCLFSRARDWVTSHPKGPE